MQEQFFFQHRKGSLSLRKFEKIDVPALIKATDVSLLQTHLEELTFSNIKVDDLKYMTDELVVKLFQIAQLSLEYLLYSQTKLAANLKDLADIYSDQKKRLRKKRLQISELNEMHKSLRNEVELKRRGIEQLEKLIHSSSLLQTTLQEKSQQLPENNEASITESGKISVYIVDGSNGSTTNIDIDRSFTVLDALKVWSRIKCDSVIEEEITLAKKGETPPKARDEAETTDTIEVFAEAPTHASKPISEQPHHAPSYIAGPDPEIFREIINAQENNLKVVSSDLRSSFEFAVMQLAASFQKSTTQKKEEPSASNEWWNAPGQQQRIQEQLPTQMLYRDPPISQESGHRTAVGELESDSDDEIQENKKKTEISPLDQQIAVMSLKPPEMIKINDDPTTDEVAYFREPPTPRSDSLQSNASEEIMKSAAEAEAEEAAGATASEDNIGYSEGDDMHIEDFEGEILLSPKSIPMESDDSNTDRITAGISAINTLYDTPAKTLGVEIEEVLVTFPLKLHSSLAAHAKTETKDIFSASIPASVSTSDLLFELRRAASVFTGISHDNIDLELRGEAISTLSDHLDCNNEGGVKAECHLSLSVSEAAKLAQTGDLTFLFIGDSNKERVVGAELSKGTNSNAPKISTKAGAIEEEDSPAMMSMTIDTLPVDRDSSTPEAEVSLNAATIRGNMRESQNSWVSLPENELSLISMSNSNLSTSSIEMSCSDVI